jgi:hypothetical protein
VNVALELGAVAITGAVLLRDRWQGDRRRARLAS